MAQIIILFVNKVNNSDIIFFRWGFYGFWRLNSLQTGFKYVSLTWYRVDIVNNYNTKISQLYKNKLKVG